MKIPLNLSKHCIETEIKRLYTKALSDYFKSKIKNHELEQTLSMVQQALETFDFRMLRSQYPALAGGTTASVFLGKDHDAQFALTINNETVNLCLRDGICLNEHNDNQ